MGQEKFDAATESARAMAVHLATMNLKFGARALRHMMTGTTALMSLAASRSVGQTITRHAKLTENVLQAVQTVSELSDFNARLASRGLEPIHARATANARRLRQR